MINEGKGITNEIKNSVNDIWNLFLLNSYSSNNYHFGNERLGYKNIIVIFNKINNYYSNLNIKANIININIGIPSNYKENKVKEIIVHELTHLTEILGLNNKDFPKYNNIKKSLIEFKNYQMSKPMEFIQQVFYKTLDNEINANISQTYILIKNDGRCSKLEALERLKNWDNYKLYKNIEKINTDLLTKNLNQNEINEFNNILLKNKVKTINSNDIKIWLNYWFNIFKRKADTFLKNSERILLEVEKDWELYESYVLNDFDNTKILNFNDYIKPN